MPREIGKIGEHTPLIAHICRCPIRKETIQLCILSGNSRADTLIAQQYTMIHDVKSFTEIYS